MVNDDEPPLSAIAAADVFLVVHYQNNILIPIIERILPNGAEAWRLVAIAYKAESGKHELHTEEDLCNNWVRKLCNSFKKLTGSTGDIANWIHHCIEIERCIQCQSNSWNLGALSVEDSGDLDPLQDEASGGPSNHQNDSQDGAELESVNQGMLDAEVPPTLTIPTLPPTNASGGELVNPPCPVVTAHVTAPVTTPSNPTHSVNTPASSSASKASKKLLLVSLSRRRIRQTERGALF